VFDNLILGGQHRLGYSRIGAASAEISAHALANALGIVARMTLLDQSDCAHDLAWRAESALKAVMRDKSGLNGMKPTAFRNALDREDVRAVAADGEREAGIDPSAVDNNRARSALPAVAPLLRPGQIEAFSKEVEQRDPGVFERNFPGDVIHVERNNHTHSLLRGGPAADVCYRDIEPRAPRLIRYAEDISVLQQARQKLRRNSVGSNVLRSVMDPKRTQTPTALARLENAFEGHLFPASRDAASLPFCVSAMHPRGLEGAIPRRQKLD
jgi:hypothetical protein